MAGRDIDAAGGSSGSTAIEGMSDRATAMALLPETAVECSELDQDLWRYLPEVLVQGFLRFLPAESVFKFRSVCKSWQAILTDPSFLESRLGAPHQSPLCVLADVINYRFALYNINSDKWYYLSYDNFFTGPVPAQRTILRAAAAGLVLLEVLPEAGDGHLVSGYGDRIADDKPLLLVNPVNKSYRQLPDLEDGNDVRCFKVVGIDYDHENGSFQILASSYLFHIARPHHLRLGRTQLHVYDLKANTWDMIYDSSDSAVRDVGYDVVEPAVRHGGFWYYLAKVDGWNLEATTQIFRVKKGVAEVLQAPLPQEPVMIVDFLRLSVCQGKLILAGSLKTKDNLIVNEWASFRFWLLDEVKLEWVDYLRMPLHLLNYLGDRRVKRFALDLGCSVDGDHICFWVGRPAGKEYKTIEMIIYNISKDSWWPVDSDVYVRRSSFGGWDGHRIAMGLSSKPFSYFLFKPNLNITL